jgi:hypothetical protein
MQSVYVMFRNRPAEFRLLSVIVTFRSVVAVVALGDGGDARFGLESSV